MINQDAKYWYEFAERQLTELQAMAGRTAQAMQRAEGLTAQLEHASDTITQLRAEVAQLTSRSNQLEADKETLLSSLRDLNDEWEEQSKRLATLERDNQQLRQGGPLAQVVPKPKGAAPTETPLPPGRTCRTCPADISHRHGNKKQCETCETTRKRKAS